MQRENNSDLETNVFDETVAVGKEWDIVAGTEEVAYINWRAVSPE